MWFLHIICDYSSSRTSFINADIISIKQQMVSTVSQTLFVWTTTRMLESFTWKGSFEGVCEWRKREFFMERKEELKSWVSRQLGTIGMVINVHVALYESSPDVRTPEPRPTVRVGMAPLSRTWVPFLSVKWCRRFWGCFSPREQVKALYMYFTSDAAMPRRMSE